MKCYYAYVGQNATTGKPNKVTGYHSMYGDIVAFSSKEKRNRFFDEYYDYNNPSVFVTKCNKTTARQFNLGMTVHAFNEYIAGHVNQSVDKLYNSFFK